MADPDEFDLARKRLAREPDPFDKPKVDAAIVDAAIKSRPRPPDEIAEDVLTRGVSGATMGFAEKAKALLHTSLGHGNYDDLVAKYRKEVEEAGQRLGPAGTIASDIGGGLLTGSLLARGGVTALGRVPATASLPVKAGVGAVEGAGYGAVHGAGHTDDGNYTANMTEGATGGAVLGGATPVGLTAAQRVLTPFPAVNPTGRAPLVGVLDARDIPISAGQRTGNPTLRLFEDVLDKLPLGRFFGGDRTRNQMQQATQAAMRDAGLPTPEGAAATPAVINDGFQRIGGGIGAIQGQHPVRVDNAMLNDAVRLTQQLPQLHEAGKQATIQHYIDRLTSSQTLSPQDASTIRTQLGRAIRAQNGPTADKIYQSQLQDVQHMLDEALERSMTNAGAHDQVAELQGLRRQYTNLNVLADGIARSGASGEAGVLTPSALSGALSSSVGKINAARGRGNLHDLASSIEGVLQSPKDSFTTTRANLLEPQRILMSPLALMNRPWPQAYLGFQRFNGMITPEAMAGGTAGSVAAGEPGAVGGVVNSNVVDPTRRFLDSLID